MVVTSPYRNHQFNPQLGRVLKDKHAFGPPPFDKIRGDLVRSYLKGMREIAERYDRIFVDLLTAAEEAAWLLNDDKCHYNDVGQRVLGFLVFNAIAGKRSLIEKKHQTST